MKNIESALPTIRITVIDDDVIIRKGYSILIDEREGLQVVSQYPSAEQALRRMKGDQPDIVLLDIGLPGISGIETISRIKQLLPSAAVLILSVHESEEMIFSALNNGASGYLTKDSSPQKIVDAIKEIMTGGGSMSANVARMVIKSFHRNDGSPLSKRETTVLQEIAQGKSRSRIASDLFIDYETVKSHLKNIYSKLKVHSRYDAIRTARQKKII